MDNGLALINMRNGPLSYDVGAHFKMMNLLLAALAFVADLSGYILQ